MMADTVSLKNKELILSQTSSISKSIISLCSDMRYSLNSIEKNAKTQPLIPITELTACLYCISSCRKSITRLNSYANSMYKAFNAGFTVIESADGVDAYAYTLDGDAKELDNRPWQQRLREDGSISEAFKSGTIVGSTTLLGLNVGGSAEGNILGGTIKRKNKATWNPEEGDAGIEMGIEAKGYGLNGKLSGNIGKYSGTVEGSIGEISGTGAVGLSLYKNGKLSPSIEMKGSAKAALATGSAEIKVGSEDFNRHVKGSGTLLGAEADASLGAGNVTYEGMSGVGVVAEVGAEAYVAEGEISGGFTIFGIEIDAAVSGKAGGAGVEAGGAITTNGVSGKIGAGLGLGAGVEISVDWTNFSMDKLIWW